MMYSFKLNKLVRDKLIERMKSSGVKVNYRILDNDEYVLRLKEKVVEEALEVLNAKNIDEVKTELGDLTEVINSLIVAIGISNEDIKNTRAEKAELCGGFKEKIYIESVSNVNEEEAQYYFSDSNKYLMISNDD